MGSIVLLDLVGGISLLLWGLHMVQSGILRAFGADLRRVLGVALRNRFAALAAGIGVTALLQSSTATGLMATGFVADGLVGLVPALAVWRWPSAALWPWIVLVAIGGTFSHYCFARALHHADATVVVPMDFIRVPLTALLGWWIYAERFDRWAVLGAALILVGNGINLARPAATHRRERPS